MKKRERIKNWLSTLPIFIIFLITISSTVLSSYSQQNDIVKKDKFSLGITIAGYKSGDSISLDELKKKPILVPDREAFEIMSFTWGASCLGGTFRQVDIIGNSFPQEHIALFAKVYFLFVDNIKAKNKVGQIVYLKPFYIKIVDKNQQQLYLRMPAALNL